MKKMRPLSVSQLHTTLPPDRIPWEDSTAIPRGNGRSNYKNILQPRAIEALELALHINAPGYNVFISGEHNLGRSYMLQEFLRPLARKAQTPPDLVYVNNFSDPDKPRLLVLPPGQGQKLKVALSTALQKIRKEMPGRFEATPYVRQRSHILNKFQDARSNLLTKMNSVAGTKGFHLDMDENSALTLYPVLEGKRLSEEEFERLDTTVRQDIKRKGDSLLHAMTTLMRQLSRVEQDFREDERSLEKDVIRQLLDTILTPAQERILKNCPIEELEDYFRVLREDILQNPEAFLPREAGSHDPSSREMLLAASQNEGELYRYDVNVFVDNSQTVGAPILLADHPSTSHLLGCIEREAEMGALITDFTLIKAGALHKANYGFLLIRMEDILQHPHAWEGLLRSLRSGFARIDDSGDMPDSTSKTKGIEPDPLPLNLKVLLIGTEDMYEALLATDDRFSKLFRIKAHMTEQTERNATCIRIYLQRISQMIDELQLLPFHKSALAGLVDYGSQLVEDQRKLSLKFPLLREMLVEASAMAAMRGVSIVDKTILDAALEARTYRFNLVEEAFMEEYDREMIKVRTSGEAVGRVNGLSVTAHGNFEFGLPHQISCSVGVGQDGIIDLEREAELGGPIHTKAMMILKSYLTDQFARKKPLVLSASLFFEQSYAGIEGDSASGAELAALISAIADVPVRLDMAFTGAVSQSGQIMAVGGVTRKIEGFFNVCARHGLTGTQGVLIPYDNVVHLMLSRKVQDAVAEGKFAIYPIQSIEEALDLLTGIPAGRRRKDGTFTPGSLYDRVDRRLEELGYYAHNAFKSRKRKRL